MCKEKRRGELCVCRPNSSCCTHTFSVQTRWIREYRDRRLPLCPSYLVWVYTGLSSGVSLIVAGIVRRGEGGLRTQTSCIASISREYPVYVQRYTAYVVCMSMARLHIAEGKEMGGTNSITTLGPYLNGLWLAVVSRCSIGPDSKWATVISLSFFFIFPFYRSRVLILDPSNAVHFIPFNLLKVLCNPKGSCWIVVPFLFFLAIYTITRVLVVVDASPILHTYR